MKKEKIVELQKENIKKRLKTKENNRKSNLNKEEMHKLSNRAEENNAGITLVSLVITIIVLIILAGVSINLILGEEGIFTMAKRAKENTELAQIEEQEKLNALYTQLELNSEGGGETGGNSYDTITKLVVFKREIAKAIQEAGGMPPEDPIVADIETFKERIVGEKGIVAEVTKDATATEADIMEGKTAWVKGTKITGTKIETSSKSPYVEEVNFGSGGNKSCHIIYNISGCGLKKISFEAQIGNNTPTTGYISFSLDGSNYKDETFAYSKVYANDLHTYNIPDGTTHIKLREDIGDSGRAWFYNIKFE